ncbi:MAG: DNA repair protein RecN [Deltaproteobacteria bacterium]|nr:DNA repair protein RecN [Deltaproteobacteria bacterium]
MLSHLTVKNVALIESVELALGPGLTVLTGETGAGKSILVEALLLLLGQRASADVVRTGAAEAVVEGQWQLGGENAGRVDAVLAEQGLPPLEDGALLLRRVVSREGRHKQQVNGALCTVAQLRAVAEPLVDFTGQHAHQQLLRRDAALPLLDGLAGLDADVTAMAQVYAAAAAVQTELAELRQKEAEKERRLDVIRFYLDEIEALAPEPDENERLEVERRRLQNAGRLRDALTETRALLCDGDDDALTKVQQAQAALKRASRDDPGLADVAGALDEAAAVLGDVAHTLRRRGEVEDDPGRLAAVEDRLDALKRVMKKHGGDLAGVLRAQATLTAERAGLEQAGERVAALEARLRVVVAEAAALARRISARRAGAAPGMASAIEAELPALGMPSARVTVRVEPLTIAPGPSAVTGLCHDDGTPLSRTGSDRVELLFSANAGEAPEPLAKVASGGELSRVLLAVKRVLLQHDPVPVSVFDEVDAGVGGAVGEAIGEKLEAIAGQHRQALAITHLPQIACRGETHLVIEKGVDGGRTVSRVRTVIEEARVDELARMLGGREITAATLEHARDVLSRAAEQRRRDRAAATTAPAPALAVEPAAVEPAAVEPAAVEPARKARKRSSA